MNQPQQIKAYKADKSKVVNLEKGKIPPQSIDLEVAVLGACLIDKYAIGEAVEILSGNEDVFYKAEHPYIYKAMFDMFSESIPVDLLTLSTHLKENNQLELVGGDFYLIGLTQKVSTSAHIEHHCRILMQHYVKRHSIKIASDIIEASYDASTDVFDVLETSQRALDDTAQWLLRKKPTDLKTGYDKFLESKKSPVKSGIQSKFTKLRKKMSYHPGDLVIIAARPGMGKTTLILNEMKYMAQQGIPVGFLSLEMMTAQIIGRFVAEEFGIDANRIKEDQLTPSELEVIEKEGSKLSNLQINIHDEGSLNIMSAKTIIGKWVRQKGVKIVFIDYLQLMEAFSNKSGGNREQEISYISRTLKSIAKEFEIPIVALSQLSRAVETRGGSKRAMLSDLRESGAIEQDADVVAFIYRPEYYKIDEWDDDERGPTENQTEIDIAKIREGKTGYTRISSILKYMRMEDLEEHFDWEKAAPLKPESPENAFGPSHNKVEEEDHDDLPF